MLIVKIRCECKDLAFLLSVCFKVVLQLAMDCGHVETKYCLHCAVLLISLHCLLSPYYLFSMCVQRTAALCDASGT